MIGSQVQGSVTVNSAASPPAPVIIVQGQVLSVEPTVTALTASANPALLGAGLTLTATVSSADSGRAGPVRFYDGQTLLCSTTLGAGGVAICAVSSLALGQHGLTAAYDGDANNAASISMPLNEVIKQAPVLTLAASPNPAVILANVTLSLSARAATGTPTGTVTFYDGVTVLGTAVLDASGNAALRNTSLVPGTHALQVQYAGDNANMAGASNTVSEVVQQASTLTTLATTAATLDVGQAVTLIAQVSASAGPASTGTVQFKEGSIPLGTGTLDSRGMAVLTLSNLAPGTHLVIANYSGDSNDAPSASTPLSQTITQIATTTALSADSNPLSAGAVLRLTASVALPPSAIASGALGGNISFYEGTTLLGTSAMDPGGHASLAVPGLSVGTHNITAIYAGITNYASSTSSTLAEAVTQTTTAVSAAASTNAVLAGKPLSIAVTVSSATGIPTGPVSLREGSAVLSQANLGANGTASFSLSTLSVGSHVLTVVYTGDANYAGSISTLGSVTVSLAQPALVLSGPTAPVNVATAVNFTAVLTSNGVVPTGALTLRDGASPITAQPIAGSGTLSFSVGTLALGLHAITVTYSGDANNAAASSATVSVTIQQAPTVTVLTSNVNPVTAGDSLTLTAAVSSASPQLNGVVRFADGNNTLGTATLGADGKASFTTTSLAAGLHALSASYTGDANHAASVAATLSERVVQPSAAVLSSSLNPATSGLAVTFSAKLSPAAPGQAAALPTGTVTFSDGSAALGVAVLDTTGAATLSTSSLSVGVHAIRLVYAGDLNFSSASADLTQTVASASTQITLTASGNPASFAAPLTFSAAVASNGGPATGSVVFSDGGATLGSAPLNSAGVAQLTLTTLLPGDHTLAATYAGDGRASASASAPLALTVKQDTKFVLTSASNPALTLSQIVFTASILDAGAAAATGTVNFTDAGAALGSATLDASGHATLTLPQMTAGVHAIAGSYVGDGKNFGSNAAGLTETVQLRSTLTAITSSATAASDPQQITLIAVVRGEGPVMPGGKVTFHSSTSLVGSSFLDASGVATLTLHLDAAQESVTASYGGDPAFAASDSAISTITAGAATQFTLAVNPASVTIASKQHIVVNLALHSVKGFNDTLKLGCLGLPFAATCTFSNPQMVLAADGDASVQLTIDTGNPLGAGAEVSALNKSQGDGYGRHLLLCFLPVGLVAGLFLRRRLRFTQLTLLVLSAFALATTLSGCSGLQVSGTPAGSYAFKVTASGAGTGATQSQTVTLTVTP